MQRYAFKIYYNGTEPFHGLQRQPAFRTVEGELIKAIVKTHQISSDLRTASFSLAGRTDRFVSALGNVFAVNVERDLKPAAINSELYDDIRVWARAKVPASFNPRKEALRRHYKYFAYLAEQMDLDLMTEVSQQFVGMHDFRSFAYRSTKRSSVREIFSVSFNRLGDNVICVSIAGDSFLRKMVRKIVGSLIHVGSGLLEPDHIGKLFDPRYPLPKRGIPAAPPEGLVLWDIDYSFPFEVDKYAVAKLQRSLVKDLTTLVTKKAMLHHFRSI